MRWLLGKDLRILARSPLLTGILVIYPIVLALMIGFALSSPPGKPKVAIYSGVKAGHGRVDVGGQHIDVSKFTNQLLASITPLRENSPAAAIAAVRDGRAQAAIIVPAQLISQIRQLINDGVGQPSVRLVLNDRNPLERDLVDQAIQTRIDQVQQVVSQQLLKAALGDLDEVINGGTITFDGATVSLLGLKNSSTIIKSAANALGNSKLVPQLRKVVSFATLATEGMSLASPLLGQLHSPLSIQQTQLSGATTPTASYAVAIAAVVSEMFVALLLAAAMLASERSEHVFNRLVRGLVSRGELVAEKALLSAALAATVTVALSIVIALFISLQWSRFELWVLCIAVAGLAFGALGVVLGALAREVAAASLMAFGVALPMAFLALIPSTAVSGALADVINVISFLFPFRAALEAISNAFSGAAPGPGWPLLHLAVLAVVFGALGRLALARFGD